MGLRSKTFTSLWIISACVLSYGNPFPNIRPSLNFDTHSDKQTAFKTMLQDFEESILSANKDVKHKISSLETLVSDIMGLTADAPIVKINTSCDLWPHPRRLSLEDIKKIYPTCVSRSQSSSFVRIGLLINLGFNSDTLEINMRENGDIIDYFFLFESTSTSFHGVRKPLLWEMVRNQKRFTPFLNRVVYFVSDDANIVTARKELQGSYFNGNRSMLRWEEMQEHIMWNKFMEWNNLTQYFKGDDIVGFSRPEEVTSRKVIEILKNCELSPKRMHVQIWVPVGNQRNKLVQRRTLQLGMLKYSLLQTKMSEQEWPNKLHNGTKYTHLRGGLDLTNCEPWPAAVLTIITAEEGGLVNNNRINSLRSMIAQDLKAAAHVNLKSRLIKKLNSINFLQSAPASYKDVLDGTIDPSNPYIVPWFMDCNPERYRY